MDRTIIVLNGQTIFDIAIQEYGSIDGDEWLLKDNPGLDLNSDLEEGQGLKIKSPTLDRTTISVFAGQPLVTDNI